MIANEILIKNDQIRVGFPLEVAVGVMVLSSKTHHARNVRPHPPLSPPVAKIIRLNVGVLQEARLIDKFVWSSTNRALTVNLHASLFSVVQAGGSVE